MTKQIVNNIHKLRKEIDGQIQFNKRYLDKTSETTRSLRSLELAKGWLGKMLEFTGTESPYKPAKYIEDIPPTADQGNIRDPQKGWPPSTQLSKVNYAREVISDIINNLDYLDGCMGKTYYALRHTFAHLHEASMNLGFELQRLREESEITESRPVDGNQSSNDYLTRTVTIKVPRQVANSVGLGQTIGATLQRMGDGIREGLPGNKSTYYGKEYPLTGDYGTIAWINRCENSDIKDPNVQNAPSGAILKYLLRGIYSSEKIDEVCDNPQTSAEFRVSLAWKAIQERTRQITDEGYTPEHDDCHDKGELLIASANYLVHGTDALINHPDAGLRSYWPWEEEHNKADKHDFWRRMEIAIAWILAEAERRWRADNE